MKYVVLALALVVAAPARADVGSVSPGPLSRAHAALDDQCDRCHVPFGGIPAQQCLACHRTLAERIARKVGFHATVTGQACTACHHEHHGRDAALSPPPGPAFDHKATVFPLDGRHAQLPCARCHAPGRWVGVPTACARCHADTAHEGSLGADCARCHGAAAWKPPLQVEHRTPLTGGHAKLACASCHRSGLHLAAQQACAQCHAATHGGTRAACETCHRVAAWNQVTFAHRVERLPGKHQTAACLACHPSFRFAGTLLACASCHDKQRPHGPLGDCAQCHSATSWKTRTFDHARTKFVLTGKHMQTDCTGCHPGGKEFRTTKRTCEACHANVHGAQFPDRACASCHTTAGWSPSTITHDAFALRDAHARAACASCHAKGAFAGTARACGACHADARHRGRFGQACERCHDSASWSRTPPLDHATFGFALERGHANVACARCHGGNGMRLAGAAAPAACRTCHAAPHGNQFGTLCTQCHSTASFENPPRFDHRTTDFPLELRHATLACSACHDARQRPTATRACRSCHGDPHRGSNSFDCADCHRADRWRLVRFDHDLTAYPLTGRHRIAACSGCHVNPSWSGVRTDCVACHAFDRPRTQDHLTYVACEDCHTTTSWRTLATRRRR